MIRGGNYSARSNNDRHRSLISSPSDQRSLHGSMPSKTTNSLQRAPQAAGYNLKGRNIQAPLKSSPFDVKAINSSSSLDDHPRYINENDRFMHYSVRDFKARQNNTLSASSQAALYSRGSALIEATATAEVAAYICRPCDGPGSDGGTRFDNYNSAFPPIQGTSVSSHKGGDSTRGRRTSSDGGERPPPPTSPSGHVTPQNLRDNPERLAKVKTEMCAFYERGGAKNCPYGANCNYAHGKDELKFRYTTLRLMESSGQIVNANTYLARPCMTWVMTGACPFARRCPAIHDPLIAGPLECPAWLPIATAKTNAMIIVDRLAGHRDSTVHQENPLIDQSIWENCRPSQRGVVKDTVRGGGGSSSSGGVGSTRNLELVWNDTYALVCNDGMNIISGEAKKVVSVPSQKLTDLQKLCIVRLMHNGQEQFKENHHRDYIFAPTHSLHSELCMIIQTRYFFLPDVSFTIADEILRENVVKEISVDEYAELIQVVEPKVIVAHEIAFAPKGDHFANVSIWFDASPVQLEQSQIKRSRRLKQKKKAQIRNEHTHPNANGALISRTSSADFPHVIDGIEPFVSMSPANDSDETHGLVMSILEHRIDSIIIENCTSVGDHQKKRLVLRKRQLMEKFIFMNRFHEDWTWPKREGMGNVTISTKAPPGNIMPYIPLKSSKTSPCVPVWNSFVKNIGAEDDVSDVDDSKRLSIFRLLGSGIPLTNDAHPLPHILSNSKDESTPTSNSETWKEILLGVPEGGKWEAVIRVMKNKRGEESPVNIVSNGRNMPLSTIPFVQV